jgi:hypothetical protein
MPRQISVNVENDTGTNYNVSVYDQYGGGQTQVAGSPFSLASQEPSPYFTVAADNKSGNGLIGYSCDAGGPSLNGIPVRGGQTVHIKQGPHPGDAGRPLSAAAVDL